MTVAEKLRKLRGEIPMKTFSKHIGVSDSMVSLVESGKRKPGLFLVKKLSAFSGKPLEYWVE